MDPITFNLGGCIWESPVVASVPGLQAQIRKVDLGTRHQILLAVEAAVLLPPALAHCVAGDLLPGAQVRADLAARANSVLPRRAGAGLVFVLGALDAQAADRIQTPGALTAGVVQVLARTASYALRVVRPHAARKLVVRCAERRRCEGVSSGWLVFSSVH